MRIPRPRDRTTALEGRAKDAVPVLLWDPTDVARLWNPVVTLRAVTGNNYPDSYIPYSYNGYPEPPSSNCVVFIHKWVLTPVSI